MDIVSIVLPIFFIIGLGYILRREGVIEDKSIHVLNQFVYYIALPAAILLSFWNIDWSEKLILQVLGFNLVALLLFGVFLLFMGRMLGLDVKDRSILYLTGLVGNTVYMGFPIGLAALGANFKYFIAAATPHLAIGTAFSIFAIEWLEGKKGGFKKYFEHFLNNPLFIAMVLGIGLSLAGQEMEIFGPIKKSIEMLGATASPVALLALGAFIEGKFLAKEAEVTIISATMKLVALPIFILVFGLLAGFSGPVLFGSVLTATMPTAVTSFLVSEKHNIRPAVVANNILVSTLFSLVTITLFLFALI